jgi:BON domain
LRSWKHQIFAKNEEPDGKMNRMATMNKIRNFKWAGSIWPALILLGSLTATASYCALAQEVPNPDSSLQPAAPQSTAGQRTDGQIEMDVVHALDAEAALKQDWITAGTVQGEVTLTGTVATEANRQLAESTSRKIPGVTQVVNSLKVGDPQAAAQNTPSQDEQPQYADPAQNQQDSSNYGNIAPPPPPGSAPRPSYQPNYPPDYQNPRRPQVAEGPEPPHLPVTVVQGALLKVRSSEPLDGKKAKVGTPVEFTVVRDVYAGGVIAIPRGATIHGEVTEVKQSGAIGGAPMLALKLDALDLGGQSYPLLSDPYQVKGPNKAGRTAGNAIGGALLGALIGGAVGGGGGAAIGAGAGAVGGTAASAASPGPRIWIPAEEIMDFHLNAPVTVTPVSRREAMRLSANAPPPSQRPTLYRRGPYGYGYPPGYYPPPPGYYYRPY